MLLFGTQEKWRDPPSDAAASPRSNGREERLIRPRTFRIRRLKDTFGPALISASDRSHIPNRPNDRGPERPFLLDVSRALRSLGPRYDVLRGLTGAERSNNPGRGGGWRRILPPLYSQWAELSRKLKEETSAARLRAFLFL